MTGAVMSGNRPADAQNEDMTEGRSSDDTAEIAVVVAPVESAATTAPTVAPIASHKAPRRRRRWPWITLVSVVVVLAAVAAGALWYVSGLMGAGARVARPDEGFPMLITAAQGASITYSEAEGSAGTDGWTDQGLMGIATVEGGYIETDGPVISGGLATRTVTAQILPPTPAAGQAATLDGWYFPRNPRVGLGLDFDEVEYDSPLGPMPAWFIPGTDSTWVIFTHGRGASPAEGLRIANTVSGLGYPMLLIKYRDDANAPQDDGLGNFGADEWPDLQAAVQYALDNGATRVVLAGASMGGSISLAFLEKSALADRVVGTFLDSPIADFGQVVDVEASEMGLPSFVTSAAKQVASWRYGFDFGATDYTARASAFTSPMLVVQGSDDQTVAPVVSEDFAKATGARLELFEGAGHLLSWNVDRARYEALLTAFLGEVAPTAVQPE